MAVACAFDFACAYQVAEVYECLGQLDNAILWAQVSTGAWAQDARVFRRHTDALQKQERQRAWRAFKEAAFGKSAVQINALGGLKPPARRASRAS